jgi:hypothetical protein
MKEYTLLREMDHGEQGSRQRKTHKNYHHLAICIYQRMEAKERRDKDNTGSCVQLRVTEELVSCMSSTV